MVLAILDAERLSSLPQVHLASNTAHSFLNVAVLDTLTGIKIC